MNNSRPVIAVLGTVSRPWQVLRAATSSSAMVATLSLLVFTPNLVAQQDATLSVEDLLQKVSDARQQLQTGRFRVSVVSSRSVTSADETEVFSRKQEWWTGRCRFDLAADKRFMQYRQNGDLFGILKNFVVVLGFLSLRNSR